MNQNRSDQNPAAVSTGGDLIFRDLFDGSPEALALANGEIVVFRRRINPERYDFITPGIEQLTGRPASHFTPALWDALVEETHLRGELAGLTHAEARTRYLRGEVQRWHAECRIRHRDGSTRWILDLSVPLRDTDGRVAGSFGFLHDITLQREPGLAAPTSKPHKPVDYARHSHPSIIWTTDRDLRFTRSDGDGLAALGLKPGQVVGITVEEYLGNDASAVHSINAHRQALAGKPSSYEQNWIGRDYLVHLDPINGPDGEIIGVQGVAHDITTLHDAEVRLLQREAYERALLQAIPDLMAVIDIDGRYHDFKAEKDEQHLYPPHTVIGRNLRDIPFHPDDLPRIHSTIRTAIHTGQIQNIEYRILKDDRSVWWEVRIARLDASRVIALARNIDERKQAEQERARIAEKMRGAQQLESLGVLAGGIAHDFNNLLVGILGNADLVLKELPPGHAADCITELRTAATRAAELTNLMLAYAGRSKFQTTNLDLNIIAYEVTQLVQAAITKKAVLHYELDRTLPPVNGDAAQLRQVIMNLVINAAEALGENGGDVVIRTGLAEITPDHVADILPPGDVQPGRYIFLEVSDNGCGMDRSTLRRIFDPFFTTKFTGRGLGLSASLGIVRSHHGGIHVTSKLGEGTLFTLFLPPAPASTSSGDTSLEIKKTPAPRPPTTASRILVIDDEEIVRKVVKRQLEHAGFTVLTESDGRQAVQLIADQPELIDLVLLDLTMPGMGGEEVLVYLRSIGFKHPVVLMSGYDESEASTITRKLGVHAFLRKPFQSDLLVNTLRSALSLPA